MRNLATLPEHQARFGGNGAVPLVVGALKAHAGRAGLVQAAAAALRNLAALEGNQRRAVGAGGLEACVAAMGVQGDDAAALQHACGAVWSLSLLPEHKGRAAAAGAIEAVVVTMNRHPGHPGVQHEGCGALWTLAVTADNQAAATQAGALEAAVSALANHSTDPTVQEAACGAIVNVAWSRVDYQARARNLRAEKLAQLAAEAHPDHDGLQQCDAPLLPGRSAPLPAAGSAPGPAAREESDRGGAPSFSVALQAGKAGPGEGRALHDARGEAAGRGARAEPDHDPSGQPRPDADGGGGVRRRLPEDGCRRGGGGVEGAGGEGGVLGAAGEAVGEGARVPGQGDGSGGQGRAGADLLAGAAAQVGGRHGTARGTALCGGVAAMHSCRGAAAICQRSGAEDPVRAPRCCRADAPAAAARGWRHGAGG